MSDLLDILRQAVLSALGQRPTAARRRAIADALAQLGEEQTRLAEADERVGHQVRRAQLEQERPGPRGGRPKGTGGRFVRVEEPAAPGRSWTFHIGSAIWQDLGEPAQLDIQLIGREVHLRPVESGGYKVYKPEPGTPRISPGDENASHLGLDNGRYEATIRAGEIVIGEREGAGGASES